MKIMLAIAASLWLVPTATWACSCCDDHHDHHQHHEGAASAGAPRSSAAPLSAGQARVTIPVSGMHCDYCASTVKNALTRLDGVKSVDVYLDKGEAVVVYEKGKVDPSRLAGQIDGLGFQAGPPQN